MARITPFSTRQVWHCQNSNPYSHQNFFFIIVGKGSTADSKKCVLLYEPFAPNVHSYNNSNTDRRIKHTHNVRAQRERLPMVSEYKHSHLKKYAKLIDRKTFEAAMKMDAQLQNKINEREAIMKRPDFLSDDNMEKMRQIDKVAWGIWSKYQILLMGNRYMNLHSPDIQKEIEEQIALA